MRRIINDVIRFSTAVGEVGIVSITVDGTNVVIKFIADNLAEGTIPTVLVSPELPNPTWTEASNASIEQVDNYWLATIDSTGYTNAFYKIHANQATALKNATIVDGAYIIEDVNGNVTAQMDVYGVSASKVQLIPQATPPAATAGSMYYSTDGKWYRSSGSGWVEF